jgi:hypothetical protein
MKEEYIKEFEKRLEKYAYDHSLKKALDAIGSDDETYIKMVEFILKDILLKISMSGRDTISEAVQQIEILLRKLAKEEDPTKLRILALLIVEGVTEKYENAMSTLQDVFGGILENLNMDPEKGDENDEDNNE